MKIPVFVPFLVALAAAVSAPAADPAYRILDNGTDLTGWKGLDRFWSVQSGSIVGETTPERPTQGNTFLVWQGGEVDDFEFRCQVRFQGNNSGVQYRSALVDPATFVVAGYQADLHPAQANFGMLYGEKLAGRGIIANRGKRVAINAAGEKSVTGTVGTDATFVDWEWNELRVLAVGNRLIHQINGITTVDVTDDHPEAARKGILALQLHAGAPMRVEFRNLRLRSLDAIPADLSDPSDPSAAAPADAPAADWLTAEPLPSWIWHPATTDDQKLYFRQTFDLPAPVLKRARIYATCDNRLKLFLNGKPAGESPDWPRPIERDVTALLQPGKNVIAAEAQNAGGSAAFLLKLEVDSQRERIATVLTDPSWKMAESAAPGWETAAFDDSSWATGGGIRVAGKLGIGPWGVPGRDGKGGGGSGRDPLDPLNILTAPGFVVDHLHTVPKAEQGSWVSLATDPQGRFYACDQGDKGLFRITLEGNGARVEPVPVTLPDNPEKPLSGAHGLVWAFDSLWFHRNGGPLYRLTDSDGDGLPDKAEAQPSQTGGGEHGNHAVLLTEDEKALYLVGGNHAPLAEFTRTRVQGWQEDHLYSRMWDARGHARGRLAPGGWVTRFDPDTKEQEVVCIGFRNQYDTALNRFGDLFTFDADMEWDMGTPWYRPTRICHVVSGGDFGWRSGSGKWPIYFEDSLPPVVDIGPGSPTGVASGIGAHFPARYQDAIYALDWTFGTIHAIHLTPDGASYGGKSEPFVYGSPLPVTDATVGPDGHFYFLVGGRGTQSAFFRVRYVGDESTAPSTGNDTPEAASARALRRQLEAFHGKADPAALDAAWPHLSSADRFLRHAARVAVESQPVATWADRVLAETNPQARITGAVALARQGTPAHLAPLLGRLLELDPAALDESKLLGLLRAYQLAFLRLGAPDEGLRTRIIDALDEHFPHPSGDVNTELITVLAHLRAPSVVAKTMTLIENRGAPEVPDWTDLASRNAGYGRGILAMLENHPPSREIGFAKLLRDLRSGWTLEQRRAYFTFLNEAAKGSGGASFPGFLANIRDEALANSTDAERKALADITGEDFNPVPTFAIHPPKGPGRAWTVDEALAAANRGKADFANGRSLYFSIGCGACHRHAGLGGGVGPDLTSIPNKFDDRYLVEAIVDPSKDISDQYGSSIVTLNDGSQQMGLAVENGDHLDIYPPDPQAAPISVARASVRSIEPSPISQMPPGMLNLLNETEVRDLVAYLMSAGNPEDRRFKK